MTELVLLSADRAQRRGMRTSRQKVRGAKKFAKKDPTQSTYSWEKHALKIRSFLEGVKLKGDGEVFGSIASLSRKAKNLTRQTANIASAADSAAKGDFRPAMDQAGVSGFLDRQFSTLDSFIGQNTPLSKKYGGVSGYIIALGAFVVVVGGTFLATRE